MSLPPPLDTEYIRAAAIASYKASLATAEEDEKAATDAYEAARRKLLAASNLVLAYKALLASDDVVVEQPSERTEALSTQVDRVDVTHTNEPPQQIAKKRRSGGIDVATFQQLEENGPRLTSDELVALVAKLYSEPISPKSVKNALGEYVKAEKVFKQYNKEIQAYQYSIAEQVTNELSTDGNTSNQHIKILRPQSKMLKNQRI